MRTRRKYWVRPMLQVPVPCPQSCNSTTGNISSGSMSFLCMVLITEKLADKKIPRNTNWAGNIFKTPWLLTVKLSCGIFVLRSSQRIWRTRDIFWINLREQRISILLKGALTNPFSETTECNKGEKVKFSRDHGNMLPPPLPSPPWEALNSSRCSGIRDSWW